MWRDHVHGAQLDDREDPATLTHTNLSKEDGATGVETNEDPEQRDQWRREGDPDGGERDVEQTL